MANDRRNRPNKSRKNQSVRRKGNLQIFGNIENGDHQTSVDERKNLKKNTLGERENMLESDDITKISSKG